MLFLVGLGLGDEKDITVNGLEAVRRCSRVFLEAYTSVLLLGVRMGQEEAEQEEEGAADAAATTEEELLAAGKARLEAFLGKEIILADREHVESRAEEIYGPAKDEDVALLVVGDPLCATTHMDMVLRAREQGVRVQVFHNASVMGAVAACGLQLYSFGYTVSVPFFEKAQEEADEEMDDQDDAPPLPDSYYNRIEYNQAGGMHTLCLLDIKVKEPDYEALARGRVRHLPPRFMTVNQALLQLLRIEARQQRGVVTLDTRAVGLVRLGQASQLIVAGTVGQLIDVDFGKGLHSLIICGELHVMEQAILDHFAPEQVLPPAATSSLPTAAEEENKCPDSTGSPR